MSQAGVISVTGITPPPMQSIIPDTGTSPVTGATITMTGSVVAAGTHPIRTDGTGASTIAIEVQKSQAIASTDATKIGLAAFNSANFTVDANGFVGLASTGPAMTITGNSGGALPTTANNWNILGASAAAGTSPVTTAGAASTLTVKVQTAQAIASTDATKIGLAAFDSSKFSVDANGFVTTSGSAIPNTITGNSGGALSPTAGNWNILGASTAAGTSPVTTSGSVSTLTVNVQKSQAIAGTDATKVGLAAFSSANFAVDANGFVTLASTGPATTITGDSGGALPTTANNWNIVGGPGVTTSGSGSTLTINAVVMTDQGSGTTLAADNGYFVTGNFTETLPASPAQGEIVRIVCDTASAVIVTANTGQKIRIGNVISTAAGTATSTAQGDVLELCYRTSGTTWFAISAIGNWIVST